MHDAIIIITPSVQDPAIASVYLEGTLDINQAAIIRQTLLSVLIKFTKVDLIIRNIEKIDVSFIQIIHAFLISAKNKEIQVQFNWELDADMQELLTHAGIDPETIMIKR